MTQKHIFNVSHNLGPVPADGPEQDTLYLSHGVQKIWEVPTSAGRLILMGDPITDGEIGLAEGFSGEYGIDLERLYETFRGHYYWFYLSATVFRCGSSFGALFPVYYSVQKDAVWISSSSIFLATHTDAGSSDSRNLLERLLFNYPLFQSTWWTGIKLLDTHRYLEVNRSGWKITGDFNIQDHFHEPEASSRKSLHDLSNLFEAEVERFFPDAPFAISLTGGFDGRTLVALARKKRKSFFTFCYGRSGASDLRYAQSISRKLDIPFLPVLLDHEYLQTEALDSARTFLELTEYNGNFGRPHYSYEARLLSERVTHMLTGNFGSELFRALHTSGSVMTTSLVDIFSANNEGWKDRLINASQEWGPDVFAEETDSLVQDIEQYLDRLKGMDPNQKFYCYVFEEIFRKYFGAELVMQSHYLNNRTPYLNLRFLKALTRTKWAGVHSRIYEKNLVKRRKGQVFYATFLRKTDRDLYRLQTSNGYSPADVLEPWRLPRLLMGVLLNKYLKKKERDAHAVKEFFTTNHRLFSSGILQETTNPMIRSFLKNSQVEIPQGKDVSRWITFYSIATGWQSAEKYNTESWKTHPSIL